jgi:phosphotriesterase-related protein
VKYFPEATFIDLVRGMVEAGFGKQIVWGGDLARKSYLTAYGGGPGMAYVPDQFVKRLKDQGFTQEVIDDIFVRTPARALTFAH